MYNVFFNYTYFILKYSGVRSQKPEEININHNVRNIILDILNSIFCLLNSVFIYSYLQYILSNIIQTQVQKFLPVPF